MAIIKKIRLTNFKRFKDYIIEPNEHVNILVGDNEAGKSSILEAIDLVSSGNIRKVESIGIDKLLNIDIVNDFMAGERKYEDLPVLKIELYLDGKFSHDMNGKNNSDKISCDGIRLICEPNTKDFQNEISESMKESADYFPYDYYSVRFSTFADEAYSGYKKKLKSIFIDSTAMSSDYATNDFIKRMYSQYTEDDIKERALHKCRYRQLKDSFKSDSFQLLNDRVPVDKNYSFGLRNSSAIGLESDLMIYEGKISIDSKGTGRQVFIKTDFALEKSGTNVDIILIEEPENHLSHINLRRLIERVSTTKEGQLFITTHNSLISTRLELQNLFIIHENSDNKPVSLHDLSEDTAKYFMKAPVASIVEYSLSKKAILVEGPAEYMLLEKFYIKTTGHKPEDDNVHIIEVHGLSFKRYLDVAKLLNNKVAIITDNDGDKQTKCIDKYVDYSGLTNIGIFYEDDDSKRTFEIILYGDNKDVCDKLFGDKAQDYMLSNKSEAAYTLLSQGTEIAIPEYIKGAIEWIKE